MEGDKMNSETVTPRSKYLLTCSIINILIMPICVARVAVILDTIRIDDALVFVWLMIPFILSGLLGFSASYTPRNPLMISTLVFSSISICFALFLAIADGYGYALDFNVNHPACHYDWEKKNDYNSDSNSDKQKHAMICNYNLSIESNAKLFIVTFSFISLVNNIIVTVLCCQVICKCCKSIDSSIPIEVVRNPSGNQQQQTTVWTSLLTGPQQQPFQSNSKVACSVQPTDLQSHQHSHA